MEELGVKDMGKVFVAGVGMTKVGRIFDKDYKDLALEAIDKALNDAGISLSEIDYLIVSSVFSDSILNQVDISTIIAQEMGIDVTALSVNTGESSGSAALETAVNAVKAGKSKAVLVVGVEKLSEFPSAKINSSFTHIQDYEIEGIRGIAPVNYAALLMKEYMKRYGVNRDDMFRWAIEMHKRAEKNPYAYLRFTLDLDRVRSSQVISSPLTLYDIAPLADGAAATVLVNEDLQTTVRARPIEIVATASATAPPIYLRNDILDMEATRKAFEKIRSSNSIKVSKDTALQVHDSFSVYGLLALEELGICNRGEGVKIIADMPYLNVGGGLKARGHPVGASPIYALNEIVLMMKDSFNGLRYEGDTAVVHSISGAENNAWLALLRR
jgi:acetyl-CoA C-acetyltransferase